MTQVDFYVLAADTHSARMQHAARLAAKTLALGRGLDILLPEEWQDEQRQWLWTAKPTSFIATGTGQLIQLRYRPEDIRQDWVINLLSLPLDVQGFTRIFEVICQLPDNLSQGREAWRHYRSQGISPNKHDQ